MERNYYDKYENLEKTHWWHQARIKILSDLVSSNLNEKDIKILNAGAATGLTSVMLNEFGEVISLEYDRKTFEKLNQKKNIRAVNGSLTQLEFDDNTFDVICCFDVLEHIQDEAKALNEIYRCLKPGGLLILTVPAYMFLWSSHDEEMHHFRRYTKLGLNKTLNLNNFKNIRSTYFNFILFHPIYIFRKIFTSHNKNYEQVNKGLINTLLKYLFLLDKYILRIVNIPYGVSIFTVHKK